MKDILFGLLTKTLNKSEQEVTELLYQKDDNDELILKEGVLEEILSLDSARVENIKKNAPVSDKVKDDQYKRGQKEALEGLEKTLKDEYSVESEMKGIDLVKEILSKKQKTSKLTDDEVKKHPLYLELEKNRIEKEKYDAKVKELEDFKGNIEKKAKYNDVKSKAGTLLDEMKPIVSENPSVAKTRKEDFLAKFEAYDYQIDDDNIIILKSDGSRMEDGHGNPLPFDELVKKVAAMNYDFPKQDAKGNSGTGDVTDKKTFNFTVPKSDDEYIKAIRTAKTTEEKIAIKAAYESQS